ncbi:hypothetical protein WJX74_003829 [Apatococcus lobatus]|uniref:Uncharacterized protein n=2 Tax=Apatococcus TaxID=904362 RepID=A0AAW1SS18_9CHLO
MDRKATLKLGALLLLALVLLVGLAGYGRQLREDFAHHSLMEAPEDRRALSEMLQVEEVRQRLLAEESGDSPAPAPGPSSSDSAEAPDSASYGSSAPSSSDSSSSSSSTGSNGTPGTPGTSSSSTSSSGSNGSNGSSGGATYGGIVGRRLLH